MKNKTGTCPDFIFDLLIEAPLSFLRGGYYNTSNGIQSNAGSSGYYWGSKISSIALARLLFFRSTDLVPRHSLDKGYGYPIRCVVKP